MHNHIVRLIVQLIDKPIFELIVKLNKLDQDMAMALYFENIYHTSHEN